MHREIIIEGVLSQVFNDQYERPDLDFIASMDLGVLTKMTSSVFNKFAMLVLGDEPSGNDVIAAMGTVAGSVSGYRDPQLCAKLGAFYMFCFVLLGLVEVDIDATEVTFKNIEVSKIKTLFDEREVVAAIRPSFKPQTVTSTGIFRKSARANIEECPIAFDVMEKAHSRSWQINEAVLTAATMHFSINSRVFIEYCQSSNPTARESKKRLCRTTIELATELCNVLFYHRYFFDFRGRVYPATGFLHEQGTDLAKGLIMLGAQVPLGQHGAKWLKHSAASNWANDAGDGVKTDKLSMEDRVKWADENMHLLLGYAVDHLNNTEWMSADSPWQFLAVCFELLALEEHIASGESEETFMSGLVCYIDGSCNGSQHLAALTKDEDSAMHVNLRSNTPIQDLYKHVSKYVWEKIHNMVDGNRDEGIDSLISLNRKLLSLEGVERSAQVDIIRAYRKENADAISELAPYYWARVTDPNVQRKLCKRGVMTLVYGVTRFGAGDQVMEDVPKHNIRSLEGMDAKWAIWLGGLIYDTMLEVLPRSTALLRLFRTAGARCGSEGRSLRWHTPIVNFPVVQNYASGKIVKVTTTLFDEKIVLSLRDNSILYERLSKQQAGAAPNIVHSLDAAHLMLTAHYSSAPVVSVHDSFGSNAGWMEKLYQDVRSTFVMLYINDPLPKLLEELGIDDLEVSYGNFDVTEVLSGEFCFI